MGIFSLFTPPPEITEAEIPEVTAFLAEALDAQRDLFYAGMIHALRTDGIDASRLPKVVEEGTGHDSALRAIQLVSVVGFCYRYMNVNLFMPFDRALSSRMDNGNAQQIGRLRESYLDCEGDFPCLTQSVASDIHGFLGSPTPGSQIKQGVAAGIDALIVMSQACAAEAAGDTKTERRLKRSLGLS